MINITFAQVEYCSAQPIMKPIIYRGYPHQLAKEDHMIIGKAKENVYIVSEVNLLFLIPSKYSNIICQVTFPANAVSPKIPCTGHHSTLWKPVPNRKIAMSVASKGPQLLPEH